MERIERRRSEKSNWFGFFTSGMTFLFNALKIVEIQALLLMIAFATLMATAKPEFFNLNVEIIDQFDRQEVESSISEYVEHPVKMESDAIDPVLVEYQEDFETYSFKYTSLGFFTKSLDFLEEVDRLEAEQRITALIPTHLQAKARRYIRSVLIISEKYQVDPLWVISVMWTESHFQPFIKSSVGADGLMQVMPKTRKYLYRQMKSKGKSLLVEDRNFKINDYFNYKVPRKDFKRYVKKLVNIELGVIYLKRLLKRFNYNHRHATIAYNMGPSWTTRRINRNLPLGDNNIYLNKVMRAYETLVRRI